MTTLYVSDLDGTLLNSDSQVSPTTSRLLTQLHNQGALFTIATARTPATVEPLLAHTPTTPLAAVMTGASLWDRTLLQYHNPQLITPDTCRFISQTFQQHNLQPFVYTLGHDSILHAHHNNVMTPMDTKFINERRHLALKQFHIDNTSRPTPVMPDTLLYFAMGHSDNVFPAASILESDTRHPTSVSAYIDIWGDDVAIIEVKAPGTSKADSVAHLKQHYNADRLVVFGDNLNDISMMSIADVAVAVANAVPQVRQAAHIIIGDNNHDAVAQFVYDDYHSHL